MVFSGMIGLVGRAFNGLLVGAGGGYFCITWRNGDRTSGSKYDRLQEMRIQYNKNTPIHTH